VGVRPQQGVAQDHPARPPGPLPDPLERPEVQGDAEVGEKLRADVGTEAEDHGGEKTGQPVEAVPSGRTHGRESQAEREAHDDHLPDDHPVEAGEAVQPVEENLREPVVVDEWEVRIGVRQEVGVRYGLLLPDDSTKEQVATKVLSEAQARREGQEEHDGQRPDHARPAEESVGGAWCSAPRRRGR